MSVSKNSHLEQTILRQPFATMGTNIGRRTATAVGKFNRSKEIKMFRNRFILILGLVCFLSLTMALSGHRSNASLSPDQGASDFHQRHPDWTWMVKDQNPSIPIAGDSAFPDYFQRHPELSISAERSVDTTDYFFRHLNKNTSSLAEPFSPEQIRREYFLGERYGVTPQGYAEEQALREYWLGERYGQTP